MNRLRMLVIWLICLIACVLAILGMLVYVVRGSPRAWMLAISHDQTFNALLGGNPDETLSSRAARGKRQGIYKWCVLCRFLDLFEAQHCEKSEGP